MKLASICNLKCTYCYWFRNGEVRDYPNVLNAETRAAFVRTLAAHLKTYKPREFSIIYHGGEPLLYGKKNLRQISNDIRAIERETGVKINLGMTTNGLLMDPEWIEILKEFEIAVSVSLDTTRDAHDRSRIDFKGKSSYANVVNCLGLLRSQGISPGLISVCDPMIEPKEVFKHFVHDLKVNRFNVLIPDYTFEDHAPSIAKFYRGFFDLWYDEYAAQDVDVPILRNMLRTVLGKKSSSESIGSGANSTVTINTDGRIEHHDALNIIPRQKKNASCINVHTHALQDIVNDPWWTAVHQASSLPSSACGTCELKTVCGGGFIAHRWSESRGFDNPSVYCSDYMDIYTHIFRKIYPDLYYKEKIS
ncbi:radical SAM protein [Oligoflexus tunisiensis]|uniref:radical SAM protein n=1 Tax=Oligoflexus tunisiensis TaxID=708132 RepID=UPI001C4070EF|nr:radical SAM protein [Oligoflexus tunisiensis]